MSGEQHGQSISAMQVGDVRMEYRPPDLVLAYAALAPKVTEAWALLRNNRIDEAKSVLAQAQAIIDTATLIMALPEIEEL